MGFHEVFCNHLGTPSHRKMQCCTFCNIMGTHFAPKRNKLEAVGSPSQTSLLPQFFLLFHAWFFGGQKQENEIVCILIRWDWFGSLIQVHILQNTEWKKTLQKYLNFFWMSVFVLRSRTTSICFHFSRCSCWIFWKSWKRKIKGRGGRREA